MKRTISLLVLGACVLASQAIAQSRPKASSSSAAASQKAPPSSAGASRKASSSSSGADLGFKRVGAAVGYVSPENLNGTFSLGVFADCGHITPNVAVESRIDYWSHSESSFGVEASVRDIVVGARGKYFFEMKGGSNLRPFAGAGLGLHFLRAEATIPPVGGSPGMTVEDSSTKLGIDLGGGVATAINPQTDLLGELWYGIVSDVSQFSLRVGLSYRLGS